jgi:hypothetical protein
VTEGNGRDPGAEVRRRIVFRATLYVYGFMIAAIVVAVGGAALVALLVARAGLPFVKTWIVLSVVILLPSLLMLVWRAFKERSK